MYLANDNGVDRNRFVKNNVLQIFFIAFPVLSFIAFFRYLNSKDTTNGTAFFLIVILPFTIAILIFFVFVTIRMMKRWNNTIEEINFEKDKIFIKSFSILWFESKQYTLSFPEFNIKKSNFQWYGKNKKDGMTLTIKNTTELYLVKDYFEDYEIISNELNGHKLKN